MYCVVYGTRGGKKKEKQKSWIFIIRKKNQLFGNLFSNFDFLIITKNLGGLAAIQLHCIGWGDYVCDHFQLPHHVGSRTPSSEGLSPFPGMRFVMSGAYHG